MADLRFTPAETAEFLNQVMKLDLAPGDIGRLEQRTEGWIAISNFTTSGHSLNRIHSYLITNPN